MTISSVGWTAVAPLSRAFDDASPSPGTGVVYLEDPQRIVIRKRGIIWRGICCFAAGSKQIPRQTELASE